MRKIGMALGIVLMLCSWHARAQEALCAEVKIEILQELTMERQGFEALMRITNTLDSFALENISVEVVFKDADNNDVLASSNTAASNAAFFIRLDDTQNVQNLQEGAAGFVQYGRIDPNKVGELHWLIIPTAKAAGASKQGKLYFVGAQLKYTYGGKEEVVNVAADSIIVKPQPLLTLDYFLTKEINGDDAFTPAIEPAEPYTLGARIHNNGYGVAQAVKIESAQPKIIENKLGLAAQFHILGSYIQDKPATPSLLVNFGNIEPQAMVMGRWIMETNLSGKFINFTASFTHADELGGELTSLLQATNAHFLVKDVKVDLAGRDNIRDFLAYNTQDELLLYESENTGANLAICNSCQAVNVINAKLDTLTQTSSQLTFNAASGWVMATVTDPFNGAKILNRMVRRDGTVVNAQNVWLSKHRMADGIQFEYKINLLDANPQGTYTLYWGQNLVDMPQAPVIQLVPAWATAEGTPISFNVQASDPNNTTPFLSATQLPTGALFTNTANNTGIFKWSPAKGQAGQYRVTFMATDGQLTTERSVMVTVHSAEDSDGDGMNDAWEIEHFGDLSRDGTGDFDGDGRTDLQEFNDHSNPQQMDGLPAAPQVLSPIFDGDTLANASLPLWPKITVTNGIHPANLGAAAIVFELYADAGLTQLISSTTLNEGTGNLNESSTTWALTALDITEPFAFADNQLYYWRAKTIQKANSAMGSAWVKSQFFINTQNDLPTQPQLSFPQDQTQIANLTPTLIALKSTDRDRDPLSYQFKLFSANNLTQPLAVKTLLQPNEKGELIWALETPLTENATYQWQVVASDSHGGQAVSALSQFLVSRLNDAPSIPVIQAPKNLATDVRLQTGGVNLIINPSQDPEGVMPTYEFELDRVNTFDSAAKLSSGNLTVTQWQVKPLAEDQTYFWRVRAFDGQMYSAWSVAQFAVSSLNQPPSAPSALNPVAGSVVNTLTPVLQINPAQDPEQKPLVYRYQLFANQNLTGLVLEKLTQETQWTLTQNLTDKTAYYWRVRAEDDKNAASEWSNTAEFSVLLPPQNTAPDFTWVLPNAPQVDNLKHILLQWVDADPDNNANIELYYQKSATDDFTPCIEACEFPAILITGDLSEDADGESDQYVWNTTAVAPGIYHVFAIIRDDLIRKTVKACCQVEIAKIATSTSSSISSAITSSSSAGQSSSNSNSSGGSSVQTSRSTSSSSSSKKSGLGGAFDGAWWWVLLCLGAFKRRRAFTPSS